LEPKSQENCALSVPSRFGAFGLIPGPPYLTSVHPVPVFFKKHTVTDAIFVDDDVSAS